MDLLDLEHSLIDSGTVEPATARSILQANSRDGSFFRTAAMKGYLNAVKFFVEARRRFDVSSEEKDKCTDEGAADEEGNTPLHLAALKGHVAVVEYLLSEGAYVNVTNKKKETPLHQAAVGGCKEVVELLLSYNADFICSEDDYFPIDCAVKHGHFDIVKMFADAGLVTVKSLCVASEAGDENIMRRLLENDVFYDPWKYKVASPLHLAVRNAHLGVCRLLLMHNVLYLFSYDEEYRTPLHCAAEIGHVDITALLLSHGAPVLAVASKGRVPLSFAAERGHIEVTRLIISEMRDCISDNNYDNNIFWGSNYYLSNSLKYAARGGHFSIVQLLVEAGAKVNHSSAFKIAVLKGNRDIAFFLQARGAKFSTSTMLYESVVCGRLLATMSCVAMGAHVHNCKDIDKDRDTATYTTLLNIATKNGFVDVVRFLLQKGANANSMSSMGDMPLHLACRKGHENVAKILVAHGASVNAFNRYRSTPLHFAKCSTVHEFLLENGADPNIVNNLGETVLHGVCCIDHVRVLLQYNVLIDARDTVGDTPLFHYCKSGQADMVKLLIEHGASVNARNKFGDTPLFKALKYFNSAVVKVLLKHDVDLAVDYGEGRTALHIACSFGLLECTRVLLDANVNVNVRDVYGNTALHEATENGSSIYFYEPQSDYLQVCDALINNGAQVNAANVEGQTPLHNAAKWAGPELIQFLLNNGADPLQRNKSGETPLELAQQFGRQDTVSVLEHCLSADEKHDHL